MNPEEKVMQLVGQASMCWSPIPSGVFDAQRATDIGRELLDFCYGGPERYVYGPLEQGRQEGAELAISVLKETFDNVENDLTYSGNEVWSLVHRAVALIKGEK